MTGIFVENFQKLLSQTGRSFEPKWTLQDGSGRAWIKVDSHSTKDGRSLGINQSVEVDGPHVSKWAVKIISNHSFDFLGHILYLVGAL